MKKYNLEGPTDLELAEWAEREQQRKAQNCYVGGIKRAARNDLGNALNVILNDQLLTPQNKRKILQVLNEKITEAINTLSNEEYPVETGYLVGSERDLFQ